MNSTYRSNILSSLLLTVFCIISCDHANPVAPELPQNSGFESAEWTAAAMPLSLLGEWYERGKVALVIEEDSVLTLQDFTISYQILEIEKADEKTFRLTLRHGSVRPDFSRLYLQIVDEITLTVAPGNNTVFSLENSREIKPGNSHQVTRHPVWEAISFPEELIGDWISQDQETGIALQTKSLLINGVSWEIMAAETNYLENRWLVRQGSIYKAIYYKPHLRNNLLLSIPADVAADISAAGKIASVEYRDYYQWWNIFDYLPLKQGARWRYAYAMNIHDGWSYNDNGSWRSTEIERKGRLELEVTRADFSSGSGRVSIKATFQIERDVYHYAHKLAVLPLAENVQFTSLDSTNTMEIFELSQNFEIVQESDTLWYALNSGRSYFAPLKMTKFSTLNLLLFNYPEPTRSLEKYGCRKEDFEFIPASNSVGPLLSSGTYRDKSLNIERGVGVKQVYFKFYEDSWSSCCDNTLFTHTINFGLLEFTAGE